MKLKRFLSAYLIAALMGILAFSCIDQSYDLDKLSGKIELFGNSIAIPVGTTTIVLDSVIGGLGADSSVLNVRDGVYVFEYASSIDMSGLTSALGDFVLAGVNPISTEVNLYDASMAVVIPFDIPALVYYYSGQSSMTLPDFSTDLIAVDSIDLDHCMLRFVLQPEGLSGPKLKESIRIRFIPQGSVADYYDQDNNKLNEWTIQMGDTLDIELRKLRMTSGLNSLDIKQEVTMDIAQTGDVVADQAIQTKMHLEMSFVNPPDYKTVYGKVDYSTVGQIDPIDFELLSDLLGENDVLSFYNPRIELNAVSNLGLPILFNLNLETENTGTGQNKSLNNTDFYLSPATSPDHLHANQLVIDKTQGTDELFKINPNRISMSYSFASDRSSSATHFVPKNTQINMDYSIQLPLQFGNDFYLGMGSTMHLSLDSLDILAEQEDLSIALNLAVKNRIPLNLKLQLTALDADSLALFAVESGDIAAASPIDPLTGFATNYTETQTDISLNSTQINLLRHTNKLRVEFLITVDDQHDFVSIQPSDYVELAIGLQIEGGLVLDFNAGDTAHQ